MRWKVKRNIGHQRTREMNVSQRGCSFHAMLNLGASEKTERGRKCLPCYKHKLRLLTEFDEAMLGNRISTPLLA